MFEEKTYQYLLAQALTRAPAGIDTRQGSIYRDSMAGQMLVLASMYVDLDNMVKLLMLDTAESDYLDDIATIFSMERNPGTLATYEAVLTAEEGAALSVEEGTQFYADELYFGLYYDTSGNPYFECETGGTAGNYIQYGTEATPVSSVSNLEAATFGSLIQAAIDLESDDDFRERIRLRIQALGENGNWAHYKKWCEEVNGVGYAHIIPLWNGPNTVKGIIFNEHGGAASSDVVSAVQNYIDPASKGLTATVDGVTYVVGDGLGEGAANLGAHFTAVAPTMTTINIDIGVYMYDVDHAEELETRMEEVFAEYFRTLTRNSSTGAVVRIYDIISMLMADDEVYDIEYVKLNNATSNIHLTYEQVATLGTLQVAAYIYTPDQQETVVEDPATEVVSDDPGGGD